MENANPMTPNPSAGSKGSLVGSIIVVLVILIGGGYLLLNRSTSQPLVPSGTATTSDETSFNPNGQNSFETDSDDLSTLETEAAALDTTSLDQAAVELDTAVSSQ